ncbi:MAG TPA: hypothetical protein PKW55_08180 [Spirochaetota bacterium]|nr:hypothetical protein [Spirochaetota bacterium]HOM39052.1 hypothetical protein [Spirochaetota bacterium]HPQ49958.1 hypothetical protein [Spirochaetota bacterium]
MKKLYIFIFVLVFYSSFAHPPSKIKFDYNLNEKSVSIDIEHKVKDAKDHYIDVIEIYLNQKLIITQKSSEQLTSEIQKYQFLIPELKENDKIVIIAKCNKFGDMKREFIIKNNK